MHASLFTWYMFACVFLFKILPGESVPRPVEGDPILSCAPFLKILATGMMCMCVCGDGGSIVKQEVCVCVCVCVCTCLAPSVFVALVL